MTISTKKHRYNISWNWKWLLKPFPIWLHDAADDDYYPYAYYWLQIGPVLATWYGDPISNTVSQYEIDMEQMATFKPDLDEDPANLMGRTTDLEEESEEC